MLGLPAQRRPAAGRDRRRQHARPSWRRVRKAETGREGKKIPERDGGFVAAHGRWPARSSSSTPGTAAPTTGVVGASGLAEKDYTLALGLRLAELLRAEGCRVRLTRERDERVRRSTRAPRSPTRRAQTSSVAALQRAPDAGGARRRLLLLPAQSLLLRARPAPGRLHRRAARRRSAAPSCGRLGRNYAILREPRAIAVAGRAALRHPSARRGSSRGARSTRTAWPAPCATASPTTWRACPGPGRAPMTGEAPRVAFTATQRQRLRELGACRAESWSGLPERRRARRRLQGAARTQLTARRPRAACTSCAPAQRAPQLCDAERDACGGADAAPASCRSSTPHHHRRRRCCAKMGIEHDASAGASRSSGWTTAAACGPCWPPTSTPCCAGWAASGAGRSASSRSAPAFGATRKGSRHLNEFTMLNLVEFGLPQDGAPRATQGAGGARDGRRRHRALRAGDAESGGLRRDDRRRGRRQSRCARRPWGPHPLDGNWGIVEPWVGLGFGLERLLVAREGVPATSSASAAASATSTACGSEHLGDAAQDGRRALRAGPPRTCRVAARHRPRRHLPRRVGSAPLVTASAAQCPSRASIFLTPSLASSA